METYKIKFQRLPAQKKIFDDDLTDTLMFCGGLGSGKTYVLCMKILKLSRENCGYAGGLLCPTYSDFKRDVLPTMMEILEKNRIPHKYHQTDKRFIFPWSRGPLYCFTAEKPIAGPNLAYCGINEFSLIPFERISEMLRRVRVYKRDKRSPKQKILVGTPDDVHGWLDEFLEKQKFRGSDKFKIINAKTSENIYIDSQYSKDLESLMDENMLSIFRDGQIGRLGSDYFYYSFKHEKNVSECAQYDPSLTVHVGLDFNVGKMAATFSHKINNKQIFFDELKLEGDSNTYTMADKLKKLYPIEKMIISCDSAGKNRQSAARQGLLSDVQVLKSAGYNVRFFPSNPRLRYRQILINGMMHHDRILIHPKCKNLINDCKNVRQMPDFTKNEGGDHKLSHFCDGMDYVICFEHKLDIMTRNSTQLRF